MGLPTFTMRASDGALIGDPIPYHSLNISVSGHPMALALHQDAHGHWVVSDPISGARVTLVSGQYMGIATSSVGMDARDMRALAAKQVATLITRTGAERFLATIERARRAAGATA